MTRFCTFVIITLIMLLLGCNFQYYVVPSTISIVNNNCSTDPIRSPSQYRHQTNHITTNVFTIRNSNHNNIYQSNQFFLPNLITINNTFPISHSTLIGTGGYNYIYSTPFQVLNTSTTLIIKIPRNDNYIIQYNKILPYILLHKEAEIMNKLQYHPHILQIYGILPSVSSSSLSSLRPLPIQTHGIYYESCYMNLHSYLVTNNICLTLSTRLLIIQDILNALQYSHSQGILHGDIKLENILLCNCTLLGINHEKFCHLRVMNQPVIIKLADYFPIINYPIQYYSAGYRAPELLPFSKMNITNITVSTDIFSFGMVTYKLFLMNIHDNNNYDNYNLPNNEIDIDTAIQQGYRPSLDHNMLPNIPLSLKDIITRIWNKNATQRPTLYEIQLVLKNLISQNK